MVITQVAQCPKCRKPVDASQAESWCLACGTPLGEAIASQLPKVVAQQSTVARGLASDPPQLPMSRGDRIFRGMVGMGTVFAAVGAVLMGALGATSLFLGFDRDDMDFMIVAAFGWITIAFVLGMIYAGLLAIVARGRSFHEVSIWQAAAAGVVPGLVPAAFIFVGTLIGGTSPRDALDPLMLFPPLSAAIAVVTLLIARKAR